MSTDQLLLPLSEKARLWVRPVKQLVLILDLCGIADPGQTRLQYSQDAMQL